MVAVHTLDALGTDDRFVTSSIPVGVPLAGEEARTVYSPTASRLSTELRMPSEERAVALVHRKRLRRGRTDGETAPCVPPDESLRRRADLVHVFGSGGRPHRDRLRRPECHLAIPAAAVSLDAEQHGFTLPVGVRGRESSARCHRCSGHQLRARLRRETEMGTGPQTRSARSAPLTFRRRCWSGSCAPMCAARPSARS